MTQHEQGKPLAFVLMSFDADHEAIYSHLLLPALQEAGYAARRADEFVGGQNILKDIIAGLADAILIIADLTDLNPNVLYELGIAHGLGKPTLIITQALETLPFDLKAYRVLEYSRDFVAAASFREALARTANAHLRGEVAFGSPVADFLPAEGAPVLPSLRTAAPLDLEVDGEARLIDVMVDAERAVEEIVTVGERWAAWTAELGYDISDLTSTLQDISQSALPGKASRILQVATRYSKRMHRYANEMREPLPRFREAWDQLFDGAVLLVTTSAERGEEAEALMRYRSSMSDAAKAVGGALGSVQEFRESLQSVPPIARDVVAGTRVAVSALDEVIESLTVGEAQLNRVVNLIDQRLTEASNRDVSEAAERSA